MAEEIQYTGNTGMVTLIAGNTKLDGSGTTYTVIRGKQTGTFIKQVSIKAITATTKGMIRLFVYDGVSAYSLIAEIEVDAVTPSATETSFEKILYLELSLMNGYELKASTQNTEKFNIFAEGLDRSYYSTLRYCDTTQYSANTGLGQVSTANPNLDWTGAVTKLLTAGAFNGCSMKSITVKGGLGGTSEGIVRIFIEDGGTNKFLFCEIPVIQIVQDATTRSLMRQINFPQAFSFQAGYKIYASTEKAEPFSIMIDANDWTYFP